MRIDRSNQHLATLLNAIRRVYAEAEKAHNASPNDLPASIAEMDAAATVLRLSYSKRHRAPVIFLREEIMSAYLKETSFGLMAEIDRALAYFESWREGNIKTTAFGKYAGTGYVHFRDLSAYWARDLAKEHSDSDPEIWREFTSTRAYKRRKKLAKWK